MGFLTGDNSIEKLISEYASRWVKSTNHTLCESISKLDLISEWDSRVYKMDLFSKGADKSIKEWCYTESPDGIWDISVLKLGGNIIREIQIINNLENFSERILLPGSILKWSFHPVPTIFVCHSKIVTCCFKLAPLDLINI